MQATNRGAGEIWGGYSALRICTFTTAHTNETAFVEKQNLKANLKYVLNILFWTSIITAFLGNSRCSRELHIALRMMLGSKYRREEVAFMWLSRWPNPPFTPLGSKDWSGVEGAKEGYPIVGAMAMGDHVTGSVSWLLYHFPVFEQSGVVMDNTDIFKMQRNRARSLHPRFSRSFWSKIYCFQLVQFTLSFFFFFFFTTTPRRKFTLCIYVYDAVEVTNCMLIMRSFLRCSLRRSVMVAEMNMLKASFSFSI